VIAETRVGARVRAAVGLDVVRIVRLDLAVIVEDDLLIEIGQRGDDLAEASCEWFLSQDRFNPPAGTGYFLHNPRHFVPGYYRAVPPGQNTLHRRGFT
jgi:hypothetical protein